MESAHKKPRLVDSSTAECSRIPSSASGEALEECLQWMRDAGADGLENIGIYGSPGCCGDSLGLFARKEFKKNDVLFRLPQRCILNISHALSSHTSKHILAAYSKLDDSSSNDHDLITAELLLWVYMSEQILSKSKPFYAYLHTLSSTPPNPHYWPSNLLNCLAGTNLEHLHGSSSVLKQQSELLLSLIPSMDIADAKVKEVLASVFSYDALNWSRGHYLSRGWDNIFELELSEEDTPLVDVNQLSAMVPILDLCNHKSGEDWVTLRAEEGMLLVVTNTDLNVGDEIFGNYGDKSNEVLLYVYGFSLENNPHDTVAVKLGRIGSAAKPYFIARGEGTDGIPQRLWRALCGRVFESESESDKSDDSLSDEDEERGGVEVGAEECRMLVAYLANKKRTLAASDHILVSVRQELANLADTHADRLRARFIEWFREGQREVLSSVLVALDAMLEETHTDNGNGVTA